MLKLNFPTEIPWQRICVSVVDPIACDDDRPATWQPSLAVFRYDPTPDYQPYENQVVSYIKVVATLTPCEFHVHDGDFIIDISAPCFGALLQIGVSPTTAERNNFPKAEYPYFIDFEPKRREIYEAVTDTGELLSGSLATLSVGKSATSTYDTEDYSLDMGFAANVSLGFATGQFAAGYDRRRQVGSVTRDTQESSNVRTTDFSTERRELQSHTTQLTQMYHLLQSFHLGTNRAIFLFDPRPHVREAATTFIKSPRELEGTQELFLIVCRPKGMKNFCLSVHLESAYMALVPCQPLVSPEATKTVAQTFGPFEENAVVGDDFDGTQLIPKTQEYSEEGWEIVGVNVVSKSGTPAKGASVANWPVTFTPSNISESSPATNLIVATKVQKWVVEDEDEVPLYKTNFTATLEIAFRRIEIEAPIEEEACFSDIFIVPTDVCCCPPEELVHVRSLSQEIVYELDVRRYVWRSYRGPSSARHMMKSRHIAAAVHSEIIRSLGSSRRYPRGTVRFEESDAFYRYGANYVQSLTRKDILATPLAELRLLDRDARRRLQRALRVRSGGQFLMAARTILARALGVDITVVTSLKKAMLRQLNDRAQQTVD